MTCDQTREALLALEPAAFDQLDHLRTCAACRAFADQLRGMDQAMADHVEAFATHGDFDRDWARARRVARRPRWWVPGGALAVLAAAALALFTLLPPPPAPVPAPIVAPEPPPAAADAPDPSPPAVPAPPVAAAPPRLALPAAHRPAAEPEPEPSPAVIDAPVAADPSPADPDEPRRAEPIVSPPDEPPPAAAHRSRLGAVVVTVDPDVSGIRGADLQCPSASLHADLRGDRIRFDQVPDESCGITFRGSSVVGTVEPGAFALTADGLVPR